MAARRTGGFQPPSKAGKHDFNIIQINTSKAKQATMDLIDFAIKFNSSFILTQEPYANGKNTIPRPSTDLKVIVCSNIDAGTRPRACIYHHNGLENKFWRMDNLSNRDCVTVQTKINNTPTLIVSCYMDRLDSDCPPSIFREVVDYAKKHNMALISGSDANAQNTYWNSRVTDKVGENRGHALLDFIVKEKLFVENVGDRPTFDNGRWTNSIDLTITNAKGHDLMDHWQTITKDMEVNCSDHNFITYRIPALRGICKTKFRDIAKTDWQMYENELSKLMAASANTFEDIHSNTQIDNAAKQLADNVISAFNSSCAVAYSSKRIKPPPWETKEVREAKAGVKHRLRQARGTKSDKDWSELRSHQAEYHRLRGHTKTKKFKEFCQGMEAKSVPKRISNLIKDNKTTRLGTIRQNNGRLTESPDETLEVMTNTHFTSSAGDVCSSEQTPIPSTPENSTSVETIFSPRRVRKALSEFDPLSAAGPDGIRPIMLQKGWDSIHTAFTNIIKASYLNSHTPAIWSNSTGIFLPKPGKDDYYNPKAYRTITLSPIPLKWMERIILWHMEVDLKIHSKLNRKQFGFMKGASTETALHKIIHKIERTIIHSGMALGTFLDIEGAFDNVAFGAIEKALSRTCPSNKVRKWIMTLIKSRSITIDIHGASKTIKITRGCPQGGVLSPFLWNLVVDSLLNYTKLEIPCDMQAFADDIALLATLESPSKNDKQGSDADILRYTTQRSLNAINEWCKDSGLKISELKTHSVMFTWRRKWNFSCPLKIEGSIIEMRQSTKLLGIHIDSKLSWNTHIDKQCKKAKGILMQCRKAVGPTWGFTPQTMKWIYTAIVRPCLSYGAMIWINGLNSNKNVNLLNRVQRLANILISGALPSTPGYAMDKINDLIPINNWIEEEALKGALRLKANGHWIKMPMVNKKGNLTTHTKLIDTKLNEIQLSNEEQDMITPVLNLDIRFMVEIPTRDEYKEITPLPDSIISYTDGSKLPDNNTGAGIYISCNQETTTEESIHLGMNATVFQAEIFAIGRAAEHITQSNVCGKQIIINCDSQAAILALDSHIIKTNTTATVAKALNNLASRNQVLLRWIPAHQGYEGNERADTLAKQGARNENNATTKKLPIPRATWNVALRARTKKIVQQKWREVPPSHFTRVWRDIYQKAIHKLNRGNLRKITMFLTGHSTLNYHLNKYKPDKINKTCPHCLAEEETTNHFIGQCPKWSAQRSALFQSFYLSITEVVESFSIFVILQFINATGRMNATTDWQNEAQSNNNR